MKENINNLEGEDPLKIARTFSQSIQSLIVDYDDMASRLAQTELRIKELEQEKERLLEEQEKNALWASRVTYENVVELIASYEDASQRDEARKLIEPLLKKEQVRQLRRDIRLKAKELEQAEGVEPLNQIHIYFKDEDTARRFLEQIRALKDDEAKIDLVRRYTENKLCLKPSKALWQALYDMGLYSKSYANWNCLMNRM